MASTTKDFTDQHLTIDFFTAALCNGLQTDVTVSSLQISAGSSAGDNFCSDIFRAHVTFHRRNDDAAADSAAEFVSLIVKAMPHTEARTTFLRELQVFDKEVSMYTETLPRMSALLQGERLSAQFYYAQQSPVPLIVFEDLRASGFQMVDRTAGLDEPHCRLVVAKLGRFHAASLGLAERDARAMDAYSFGMIKPNAGPNPVMEAVFAGGVNSVAQMVARWEGFEAVAAKLEQLSEGFIGRLDRVCNGTRPLYRVLNHGDFWVNNMLFRYDGQTPTDVCFIDYQMSVFDSPGHDLNVFLNTSPQNSVRETKREQIVDWYFEAFDRALQELKSSVKVTKEMLRTEIRARELYGLTASVGLLPAVLMRRSEDETKAALTMDNFTDAECGKELKEALYGNPRYEEAMRHIVQRFDEIGVLDDDV